MAAEVWVATAPIWLGNVRAYNVNNVVPDSVVTQFGLEAEGLVERRAASDTGVPTHGVDPATQAELDSAVATRAVVSDVFAGDGKFRVDKLPASVPRTVNGKAPAANGDVVLGASDVGALSSTTKATNIGGLDQVAGDARYRRRQGGTSPTPAKDVFFIPEDFGAVGDNGTDDTVALQACINAAWGNGPVKLNRRYISGTLTLPPGTTLDGTNNDGLYATYRSGGSITLKAGTNGPLLQGQVDAQSINLIGLKLSGNKTNQTVATPVIKQQDGTTLFEAKWLIEGCTIKDSKGVGIYLGQNNRGTHVERTYVLDGDGHGVHVNGPDNQLHKVFVGTNGGNGIRVENGAYDTMVKDCNIWSNQVGINILFVRAIWVDGCYIDHNKRQGLSTNGCSGVTVTGNVFISNCTETDNTYSTVDIAAQLMQPVFAGNSFMPYDAPNRPQYDIFCSGTTGTIPGGDFTDCGNARHPSSSLGGYTNGLASATNAGPAYALRGTLRHSGLNAGFFGAAPVTRPQVSGSRADGTALASLLTALTNLGLITNTTTS